MSRFVWRSMMCSAVVMFWLIAGGCNERVDDRSTDEKMYAPVPDINTRLYMACPKCGCLMTIGKPVPEKVMCPKCRAVLRLHPAKAGAEAPPVVQRKTRP